VRWSLISSINEIIEEMDIKYLKTGGIKNALKAIKAEEFYDYNGNKTFKFSKNYSEDKIKIIIQKFKKGGNDSLFE
jgi:hypothetical protein